MTYVDIDDLEVEFRDPPPSYRYSQTGYGMRIPTHRMVKFQGRWRRVYVTCFSNAGTAWFNVRGEKMYLR